MNTFIQYITSLEWWISVVAVGILVNLVSAYLKSPSDKLLALFSKKRIERIQKNQKDRADRIETLSRSRELRVHQRFLAVHFAILSVLLAVVACTSAIAFLLATKSEPAGRFTMGSLMVVSAWMFFQFLKRSATLHVDVGIAATRSIKGDPDIEEMASQLRQIGWLKQKKGEQNADLDQLEKKDVQ